MTLHHDSRSFYWLVFACVLAGIFCIPRASTGKDKPLEVCRACEPLSSDELDEARGGLLLSTGLELSFGLERSVLVNGELASLTTLNASFASRELRAIDLRQNDSNVVQIGMQNTVSSSVLEAMRGGLSSVIQNSADQQLIQTMTVIDIVVENIDFDATSSTLDTGLLNQLIVDALR